MSNEDQCYNSLSCLACIHECLEVKGEAKEDNKLYSFSYWLLVMLAVGNTLWLWTSLPVPLLLDLPVVTGVGHISNR